jgi:hypothetical protein
LGWAELGNLHGSRLPLLLHLQLVLVVHRLLRRLVVSTLVLVVHVVLQMARQLLLLLLVVVVVLVLLLVLVLLRVVVVVVVVHRLGVALLRLHLGREVRGLRSRRRRALLLELWVVRWRWWAPDVEALVLVVVIIVGHSRGVLIVPWGGKY